MVNKLFWFVLAVVHHDSQQIIQIETLETDHTMVNSIARTIEISAKIKIAFWFPPKKNDIISDILKTASVPVVLNAVERPKNHGLETRTPCEVVIIFDEVNVDRILSETLWNGFTRFLVIPEKLNDVDMDFENFWKHKVINIFELIKNETDIDFYSFYPYQKGNCTLIIPKIVEKYQSKLGYFSNKGDALKDVMRIQNMNGCPVNITVVDVKPNVMFQDETGCKCSNNVKGIEGNLMNEVAKKLNFNATFVLALDGIGWGWINPAPHGAVGEVFTGRSDFAIGLLAPTLERYENLDVSIPYNGEECITYGIPTGAGASTPNWITILSSEFNTTTWALIFCSFFLTIIFFEVVNKLLLGNWLPNTMDVILFVFSSFLGLPVRVPRYFFLRFSMTFWIIFSFVLTVAYKSSMGSKLTVPTKDPDINTFQELLDSELEFTGYNNMLRLLLYSDKETVIQKMIDRFKVTNFDIDSAVDRIAVEKKIAYVRHSTTFLYYALINSKAKGNVHVIRDCIYLYHPMVVTKKHSPFSNRLNQLISRMMESGITKKWRSDYIYDLPPPEKSFLKLSIDHMYGVFCILGLGYILGILTIVIEITYFNCKNNIKRVLW